MAVRCRAVDGGDDPDAWRQRRLHSLSREEIEHFVNQIRDGHGSNGSAFSLSWGRLTLAAKGAAAIVLLMWVTVLAAQLYSGYRIEQVIGQSRFTESADHRELRKSQDRTSCVLTMTTEQRAQFREEYKPGAWHRWCLWMTNED